MPNFTGALPRSLGDKLGERPSALDFIPEPLHAAVWNEATSTDLSPYLQNMVNSVSDGARATFYIPRGKYIANSTIALGARRITFILDGAEIQSNTTLFSVTGSSDHDVEDGGAYMILGSDCRNSILTFTGSSGVFLDFNRVVKGGLKNLSIQASGSGTATGVRLYSADKISIRDVHITGFDICLKLSGPGKASIYTYSRTNTITLDNIIIRDYTTCGMDFSYCEEVFMQNVQSYITSNHGLWAWKIGTSCFAIYGQTVSMIQGGVKIYWVPDPHIEELPPNWLFFDNLLCDLPYGTPCLSLDASLSTVHAVGLPARGFRFSNGWFAGADYFNPSPTEPNTSPNPCISIAGGYDIEFNSCKIRAGKGHGVYISNFLDDLRFNGCSVYANWFNNQYQSFLQNGSGFYIDSSVGASTLQIIGGMSASEASDVGGHQQYGIYNLSTGVHLNIHGVSLHKNETAPINSTLGDRPTIWGNYYGIPPTLAESAINVTNATNTPNIEITTASPHGYLTGQGVRVMGVEGNFHANGLFTVTVTASNKFLTNGAAGDGAYTGGGITQRIALKVTNATNASPIVITTSSNHGYTTGDRISISGVGGNTAANEVWYITVVDLDKFSLDESTGNGTYTSGGLSQKLNAVTQYNRVFGDSVRFEIGDSNYYLDLGQQGNNPLVVFDENDYISYDRALDRYRIINEGRTLWRWEEGSSGKSLSFLSRPEDSGGLTDGLLNSQLDADSAERFSIRGDGRISWGNGTVADVSLERLSADLMSIVGSVQAKGNIGAIDPSATGIASWLVSKSVSSGGGFRMGLGNNCYFDGTNWKTKGDGASNGGALLLTEYGVGNVKIYVIPTTGGGDQTITNTNLENYLVATFVDGGVSLENLKRGSGSPEGAVSGAVGDLYQQTNGSEHTVLWTKCLASVGGDTTLGWRNRGTFASNLEVRYEGATLTRSVYGQLQAGAITADPFDILTNNTSRINIAGAANEVGIGGTAVSGIALTVFGKQRLSHTDYTASRTLGIDSDKNIVSLTYTASRALVTDSDGSVITALTTAADIGYCAGLDSNVQDQLDGKAASFSGFTGDKTVGAETWHFTNGVLTSIT